MRIGVVARTNNRGLDIQTNEAARNLDASVLVVDVTNSSGRRFPSDRSRFPGAPIVECRSGWKLNEQTCRDWLTTVDAVYTAETFYDPRFTDWARSQGVVTVVHANPEFVAPEGGWAIGNPSERWSPTCWRNRLMPQPTRVVPFPVALDRFTQIEPHGGPCRWLHVGGKQALADRNGTSTLVEALRYLDFPCTVTICTQEQAVPRVQAPKHVEVRFVRSVAHYWELYPGHDALVMPRRYGGLCLPVQEAMASGMAVLMPDIEPNPQTWPVATVSGTFIEQARMPAGEIPIATVNPRDLALAMDRLADPAVRGKFQSQSRSWASAHSWDALRPDWLGRLQSLR